MNSPHFFTDLIKDFPHTPTIKQDRTLKLLADFVMSNNNNEVFLLKGYAGTGKTTIVGTLVKNIWKVKQKS